jgi:L-ascorbate metabolism protein UlaG (beta-lactamase superfamily)
MAEDLGFRFTWYGHACVYIESEAGSTILFDPWLGNPRSPITADDIVACDVMLVTHGHFDHLGSNPGESAKGDPIRIARRTKPVWPAMHELSLWLESIDDLGASVVGMNKGGTFDARGVKVSFVHADHSSGDWIVGTKLPVYFGVPVGIVIELQNGRRIYHAGDTALFGDMRLIGVLYAPDLAFLPIGGHFTMDPIAAAHAVRLLGVKTVVPIHYGTFPILAGTPDEFRDEIAHLGLDDVVVLAPEPGEVVSTR